VILNKDIQAYWTIVPCRGRPPGQTVSAPVRSKVVPSLQPLRGRGK
jgi:hypothetical protein